MNGNDLLERTLQEALSQTEEPSTQLVQSTLEAIDSPRIRCVNLWNPLLLLSLVISFASSLILFCLGAVFPAFGIAAVVYFVLMLALDLFLVFFSLKHQNITQGAVIQL